MWVLGLVEDPNMGTMIRWRDTLRAGANPPRHFPSSIKLLPNYTGLHLKGDDSPLDPNKKIIVVDFKNAIYLNDTYEWLNADN